MNDTFYSQEFNNDRKLFKKYKTNFDMQSLSLIDSIIIISMHFTIRFLQDCEGCENTINLWIHISRYATGDSLYNGESERRFFICSWKIQVMQIVSLLKDAHYFTLCIEHNTKKQDLYDPKIMNFKQQKLLTWLEVALKKVTSWGENIFIIAGNRI